ncbi:MAG: hypothetical protein A2203_08650 [Chromatiales bacterium RIFOXYA1_FULL_46_5]|nr:MAG: hypothetical protein A2203_08650 [Chromatiales bacterium RIFOXYA1_FULL_46_5]
MKRNRADHPVDGMRFELVQLRDVARDERDIAKAGFSHMRSRMSQHLFRHVHADELDLGIERGDLDQLGGRPAAQIEYPLAALKSLRGAGGMKKVRGCKRAFLAPGFRECRHLVHVVHDGVGLGLARQGLGARQFSDKGG